jgi:DhnA family fructose-bisphosphate aldolase class Ia
MTLQERLDELCLQYGSLREVSRILLIDIGYLVRLRSGENFNPSPMMLKKLGLKRVVSYERLPHLEMKS